MFHLQSKTNVVISKLTVRNGLARYQVKGSSSSGGGIASYGNLTLDQVTVRNNRSQYGPNGGEGGYGGGVYSNQFSGVLTIVNSTIRDNTAFSAGGVAGRFTIITSHIENNRADLSGGLEGAGTITGSTISGNTATYQAGGISVTFDQLTIRDSTISNNTTQSNGGGLLVSSGRAATVSGTTFSGNRVTSVGGQPPYDEGSGGAISVDYGSLDVTNSTFSANTADANGGAIAAFTDCDGGNGVARINNSTFSDNRADNDGDEYGGGSILYNHNYECGSEISIVNTLLASSTAGPSQPSTCAGTIESRGYNLISNANGCTIIGDTTGNLLNVDPKLGPLQNNGGLTLTYGLNRGSPAIDAGNPAYFGDNLCATTDQRGAPRPRDGDGILSGNCDIGAVERQSPSTNRVDLYTPAGAAPEAAP